MSDNPSRMELVSSFMDGETGDLPDWLCRDNGAKGCWSRYHLIREVMRDSTPVGLSGGFTAKVMQALESEPTVVAPRPSRYRHALPARVLKPVAGLAIAATVAAVALVGFQNLVVPGATPQPQPGATTTASTAQTGNIRLAGASASRAAPVNQQTLASAQQGAAEVEAERNAAADDSLNGYLLEHMEQSGGHAPGMLPYVRLAGYESNR